MVAQIRPTLSDATVDWERVCHVEEIVPGTGVSARVRGRRVAIFRVGAEVYGLDDKDPFSGAHVLSRGIVGDRRGHLKVVSPIFKQSFYLLSGECVEDPAVSVAVYPVRVRGTSVEVHLGAGGQP
ncbi:MAG: nitrite reductase small subunit NirD [Myxococcota bacterium]